MEHPGRMNPDGISVNARGRPSRLTADLAWVIAATAVGAALRLYRIEDQSLWYDDYGAYVTVLEPDLRSFWNCLFGVGSVNGEQVPLYYLLQYGWSALIGDDPVAVRLLPVSMGIAVIPLAFLLGRLAFGSRAGATAAFCVALSPVHLFYSQEYRYCALLALLASLSMCAFLAAARTGRRSLWMLNGLSNFLLLWTHLFGVLLLAAQGAYLLLRIRDSWRRTVTWLVFHAVLFLPTMLWVTLYVNMPETAYECFRAPTVKELFLDLTADDAVNVNSQVVFVLDPLSALPFDAWMGYLLSVPFTLCLLWAGRKAFRNALRGGRAPDDPLLLLLLVAVLPVLALGTLSWLWKPCIFPRYTMYSSIALYVLAGGAIQSLPRRSYRLISTAALFSLLGYQLLHVAPNDTRTQWIDAARCVETRGTSNDVVFVGWPGGSTESALGIFNLHYRDEAVPVLPAGSLPECCNAIACVFAADPSIPQVWAVFRTISINGPPADFESCVEERGLRFERYDFKAMGGVSVYRISGPGAVQDGPTAECDSILFSLALDVAERGDYARADNLLKSAPQGSPGEKITSLFRSGEGRQRLAPALQARREGQEGLSRGNLMAAVEGFRHAQAQIPELDLAGNDLLGVLLKIGLGSAELGKQADALNALDEAAALKPVVGWVCRSVTDRLRAGLPAADAVAAVRYFLLGASYGGQPEQEIARYREAVKRDPGFAAGYGVMGEAHLSMGQYQEALEAFNRHNDLIADWAPVWFSTGRALLALGEKSKAREAFDKCFALDPQYRASYAKLITALAEEASATAVEEEIADLRQKGIPVFPEFAAEARQ